MLKEKGESLLSSTQLLFIYDLRRAPTIEEYKTAVKGINLTQFAPSHKLLVQ
jgi:aconitate hydratase 2/2-methylisocitrate dehydratase